MQGAGRQGRRGPQGLTMAAAATVAGHPAAGPVVDSHGCSGCGTCLVLCSEVFCRNPETGVIEAADLSHYPEEAVDEAVAWCPKDCIHRG